MTIHVRDVSKFFGDFPAVNHVNLEIGTGELVALLGPSGSGKTTLLRIIAGLEFADTGTVLIDGEDTATMHAKERHVGFVFQHYALFKHMTVFDNVAFGLTVRPKATRLSKREIENRVMALLRLVHLDQFYDRYPSQLSGGQRQRVALARALAVEPKLLLLDEPFGALDAKVRKELRRWLRRLHDDLQITSIFVTHDQEEAMEVADRVVVMNRGTIEQMGTPEEVYHSPANGFVYDFLGNYNAFAGWRDHGGKLRLSDEDVWAAPPPAPIPTKSGAWLARYPEVRRLMGKVAPSLLEPKPLPAATQPEAPPAPHEGVPVRVFARPHEMFITRDPEAGMEYIPVTVLHINPVGPLAKLELERRDGTVLQAEVPKTILDALKIQKRDRIFVRPKQVRVFE